MVRNGQYSDIPQMSGLIADFYSEIPYVTPAINVEKADYVLRAYLDADPAVAFCQVIEDQGALVGMMLAERQTDIWTDATKTVETLLYVRPSHRGKPSAGRLMLNFAQWANEVPSIIRVEASSGITDANAAHIYERLGWEKRGTLHGTEAF